MARILLHCPLNISRTLVQMVGEFCGKLQEAYKLEISVETQPHRPEEKSLFKTSVEENNLPDMTIGHIDDFADLPAGYLESNFRSLPGRFLIRKELSDIGFADNEGYFNLFGVIPFVVFYNKNMLGEEDLPKTWENLLDPRWKQKILMPDDFRIVSVVVRSFMKADFPDNFGNFDVNFIRNGSPLEVVSAVDEGQYPIGVTNIAFARISREKNTRIIWLKDGLFCMPQVMVWSNKSPEALQEVGDYLMSRPVQEYLSMQSFVPASEEVSLHPMLVKNGCDLRWKGWKTFLEIIKGRHG